MLVNNANILNVIANVIAAIILAMTVKQTNLLNL